MGKSWGWPVKTRRVGKNGGKKVAKRWHRQRIWYMQGLNLVHLVQILVQTWDKRGTNVGHVGQNVGRAPTRRVGLFFHGWTNAVQFCGRMSRMCALYPAMIGEISLPLTEAVRREHAKRARAVHCAADLRHRHTGRRLSGRMGIRSRRSAVPTAIYTISLTVCY